MDTRIRIEFNGYSNNYENLSLRDCKKILNGEIPEKIHALLIYAAKKHMDVHERQKKEKQQEKERLDNLKLKDGLDY